VIKISYSSKYTLEEAKIAREVNYLTQLIASAKTKETREKHTKRMNELIPKLNGKYGTGTQKIDDSRRTNRLGFKNGLSK